MKVSSPLASSTCSANSDAAIDSEELEQKLLRNALLPVVAPPTARATLESCNWSSVASKHKLVDGASSVNVIVLVSPAAETSMNTSWPESSSTWMDG